MAKPGIWSKMAEAAPDLIIWHQNRAILYGLAFRPMYSCAIEIAAYYAGWHPDGCVIIVSKSSHTIRIGISVVVAMCIDIAS